MKNTFTISKQQITYLSEINETNKRFFKENYPEAFEPELKTGIWYKSNEEENKSLVFVEDFGINGIKCHGFNYRGCWESFIYEFVETFKTVMIVARQEEVFERLKEEAIKRGFKKGVTVDRSGLNLDFKFESICKIMNDYYKYYKFYNRLELGGSIIFDNGVWAEICITKEEAEKELGKKII